MTQQKQLFNQPGQAITIKEDPAQVDLQLMFSGVPMSPEVLKEKEKYFKTNIDAGIDANQFLIKIKAESDAIVKGIDTINVNSVEKEKQIRESIIECRNLRDRIDSQTGPGKKLLYALKNHVQGIENDLKKPLEEAIATGQLKLDNWTDREAQRIEKENADKIAKAEVEAEKKRQTLKAKLEEAIDKEDQKKTEKLSDQIDRIEAKPVNLQKELPKEKKVTVLDLYKFMALLSMHYAFKITSEEKAFLLQQEIGPNEFFTEKDLEKLEFMLGFLQSYRKPMRFPNLSTACISIKEKEFLKMVELLSPGHYSWGNQIDDGDENKIINEAWLKIFEVTKSVTVRR